MDKRDYAKVRDKPERKPWKSRFVELCREGSPWLDKKLVPLVPECIDRFAKKPLLCDCGNQINTTKRTAVDYSQSKVKPMCET